MRDKTNWILGELTIYHLKSMRWSYFVPLLVMFLYVPLMAVLYFQRYQTMEPLPFLTYLEMQHTLPFFGLWWPVFSLRGLIEGESAELLQTYHKRILPDFLLILGWYVLHEVFFVALMSVFMGNMFGFLPIIIVQTLLFASVALFLMVLFKAISVPLLVATIYEVLFMFAEVFPNSPFSMLEKTATWSFSTICVYAALLVVSVILIDCSGYIYRRRVSGED